MKKKFPLSYRAIQKIKAEEYQRFFSRMPDYYLYMNHLGEVRWMTEEEALQQHEFFLYSEPLLRRWQWRIRLGRKINLSKLSGVERELRLRIRQSLEKKYLGKVQPETARLLRDEWKYEISEEELENIPISIDVGMDEIWKKVLIAIGILAVISLGSYLWVSYSSKPLSGKLLVRGEVESGRVYLDETDFIGYTNKVILNIPAGIHRISVFKEGYITIPKYHEVEIKPDSLVTLNFQFKLSRSEVLGFLKIVADQEKSKVFVDNGFYGVLGKEPVIALEEGQHTVEVQKEGYVTVPAQKIVHISAGDTSILMVEQVPLPHKKAASLTSRGGIGSIEITSNEKNARIYMNGKDTGYETDYVITQLPLGRYTIQLRKEGYSVKPEKIEVVLTRNNTTGNAYFELKRLFERVKITTDPASGPIYIDGEFKGEGKFEGVLKIGEHRVSFGDLPGYKTPREKNINIKPGIPLFLQVSYFPQLNIVAGIDNKGNIYYENCQVFTGYTLPNRAFTRSQEGSPTIEFNDVINDYLWKLGYAFPYRNPKGNDAIKVTFALPNDLDYNQTFTVRMLAASSRERYPLSITTKVDILVKFNNSVLSYYYEPKFLEDSKGLEVVEWDVTPYIHPGENSFEVSTTEKNNAFFYVKQIEIFN